MQVLFRLFRKLSRQMCTLPTLAERPFRSHWLSVLADASSASLAQVMRDEALPDDACWLRRPETGLVMVRGRISGDGAPFPLGELSITRCALRLADGTVGMAWVQGRRPREAQWAALIDARLQQAGVKSVDDDAWQRWIAPLAHARAARQAARQAAAERTRVNFFTVVRGENA